MKQLVTFQTLDDVAFVALLAGMGLLVGSLFVAQTAALAVPALIVLLPSLIYGMR
jgi:hypothetical protein